MFKALGSGHPNTDTAYSIMASAFVNQYVYTKALEFYALDLQISLENPSRLPGHGPDAGQHDGLVLQHDKFSKVSDIFGWQST